MSGHKRARTPRGRRTRTASSASSTTASPRSSDNRVLRSHSARVAKAATTGTTTTNPLRAARRRASSVLAHAPSPRSAASADEDDTTALFVTHRRVSSSISSSTSLTDAGARARASSFASTGQTAAAPSPPRLAGVSVGGAGPGAGVGAGAGSAASARAVTVAVEDQQVNLDRIVRDYGPTPPKLTHRTYLLRGPAWCARVGCCTRFLRHKVSRKKRRFRDDGFDLDLTYVTPNIIAMGYPAAGVENLFRNPRDEVVRFFRTRHWGHYKVYNLCSEPGRQYSPALFHASGWCPFPDHGVPALQLMYWACEDMARFLAQHPENVVAIHCKAGKGRSGLMLCMLLLRLSVCPTASTAIAFYNKQRTRDGNGVRVPSQKRYVGYYETLLKRVQDPSQPPLAEPPLCLRAVKLFCAGSSTRTLRLRILSGRDQDEVVFHGSPHAGSHYPCGATVQGNVCVQLLTTGGCGSSKKLVSLWINTAFVDPHLQVIPKLNIDTLRTDTQHRTFPRDFQLHLLFGDHVTQASSFKKKAARR